MKNLPILLIPHRQYGHFHGNNSALAVVFHHLRTDIIRRHKLAHQPIIVNVNIVN
jgi:hypothetical protein